MKRSIFALISGCFLTLAAGTLELPEPLQAFAADFKKAMPQSARTELTAPGVFNVFDADNRLVGKLYCERIGDGERRMGYAGTIEIAVLFDEADQVAGVLIGKNQETRSFLNRLRAAKFLEQWNKLKMSEIKARKVDAVTGATYSSLAISDGVRKLAGSYLAGDDGAAPAGREVIETEITKLEQSVKTHQMVLDASRKLLKQLQDRKDEELKLRFIAAVDGKAAAAAFAARNNLVYFNHPRRGQTAESKVETLGKKFKASGDEADRHALEAAILDEYEGLLLRIPPHNQEHEKALQATQSRIELLKNKLANPASDRN